MSASAPRRRLARLILALLVGLHLLALAAYEIQDRQHALTTAFLAARDDWRDGRLDAAAAAYAAFLTARPGIAWPLVLVAQFPSAADGWYLLGRVESDRHRTAAALAAYDHSVALGGRGRRERRDLLLLSAHADVLLQQAEQATARDPADPQNAKDRGAALLALGLPARAAEAYRDALRLLPAWRRRTDRAAQGGLSGEEADLLNLLAAAELRAGDIDRAQAHCTEVERRQSRRTPLDRLCRALLLAQAGENAAARALLVGYLPPAPEHEQLVRDLLPSP